MLASGANSLNSPQPTGEVILVRHGETVGQSSIRLYGHTDIALSELGWQQMDKVGSLFAGQNFQQIISSPLIRSQASAEMIRHHCSPLPKLVVIEGFREINFGRWEGWTYEEAFIRDPENFAQLHQNQHEFCFPEGESKPQFRTRVTQAITQEVFPNNQRTLAILHKGIIKVIISALTGLHVDIASQLPVFLGSIYRLHYHENGWHLHTRNEVTHLGTTLIEDK